MSEKVKRYVKYLWDELPLEKQKSLLASARRRIGKRLKAKVVKSRGLPRYLPSEESDDFWDEFEAEYGLELDDGKFRLCVKHNWQTLAFFIRERYDAKWTSVYSRRAKLFKEMREWPNLHKHTLKWKDTCISEAQVCRIEWVEEYGQYKVVFQFKPIEATPTKMTYLKAGKMIQDGKAPFSSREPLTETYWFYPDFKDSSIGEGWVSPRRVSKTKPFPRRPLGRRKQRRRSIIRMNEEELTLLKAYKVDREFPLKAKLLRKMYERYAFEPQDRVRAFVESKL